jgi:hypothetical protein
MAETIAAPAPAALAAEPTPVQKAPTKESPVAASSSTTSDPSTLPTKDVTAQTTTDPATSPTPEPAKDSAPEQLFELEIEGQKKSFKANELVDYTQEKIEAALNIHDRYVEGMEEAAKNPLQFALDNMAARQFNGDKRAAYQALIGIMDKALSEEHEYRSLPEDRRKAMEYEQEAKAAREALRLRDERDHAADNEARRAHQMNQLIAQMNTAVKETGIEDSKPIRGRIVAQMKEDQRAGLAPDAKRAALKVKEYLDSFDKGREEVVLKKLDVEFIRKHRPELVKALQEATLEETRKARDDAEKKARGEPAPREKQAIGRILPSSQFTSANW